MHILLLGGTGAMGKPLAEILAGRGHEVSVTSRAARKADACITYVQGNAMQLSFLQPLLRSQSWDVVVDFMSRPADNLRQVLQPLLDATSHYVFISSARVYAPSDSPITECSPRLLDVCDDVDYLATNEYALAKAREEDMLFATTSTNYTIVRPSITYNSHRLQLGAYEKEGWLYRAMHGRSIVFSDDMRHLLTTMTHGNDVARAIAALAELKPAGQVYNITSPYAVTWDEVMQAYLAPLRQHLGRDIPVVYTPRTTCYGLPEQKYRLKYCRLVSRQFDCAKLSQVVDPLSFVRPEQGLTKCVEAFLMNPSFIGINWPLEALNDRAAHQFTPITEMPTMKHRIKYILKYIGI